MKLLLIYILLQLSVSSAHAKTEDYDDCNWIVNYRGKTYDLAPLTRETLARPIESDMRPILQRVPESDAHLQTMSTELRNARAHTIIGSAFISTFLIAKLIASGQKNEDRKSEINLLSYVAGAFFLKATFESWHSTRTAKIELTRAVNDFNEKSPHKIEAAPPATKLEDDNAKTK